MWRYLQDKAVADAISRLRELYDLMLANTVGRPNSMNCGILAPL